MSETPKKLRLDAALASWPDIEKPAMDWEKMALSIDARIAEAADADGGPTSASVSNTHLLEAPLGEIAGEVHNSAADAMRSQTAQTPRKDTRKGESMTMPADRERDRQSLRDLAKMATQGMTPPPPSAHSGAAIPSVPASPSSLAASGIQRALEAKKDDSGIVDLAMAAQSDPHAAARAQTTPLASQGLFDDEPVSNRPGPVSSRTSMPGAPLSAPHSVPSSQERQQLQQPAPSIPPFAVAPSVAPPASFGPASAHAPYAAVRGSVKSESETKKGGAAVFLIGGLVAAAAIAAGGFFFVQHQHAKSGAAMAAMNTPAPVVATATAATPVETKPAETVAALTPAPTPANPGMDPNALPTAADPKAAVVAARAPAGRNAGGAAAAAPVVARPAAAVKDDGPKVAAKDIPPPVGPTGDLGAAMKGAVGDEKGAQTPAAGTNGPQFAAGSVPQKPSQGAVTGAIGAVLPNARACLGPDDAISRASITFNSAGTVQSVGVTGGAAGKPAEACIKGALLKAKLTPFAEPTYTANITVRH